MCGINGILQFQQQRHSDEKTLVRMRDFLAHRGPDDAGLFMEGPIGLGHRRLSILDVSAAGHQPFFSDDGRYVMVFNGEIYNFRDFYGELKSKGHEIRTGSDTEVLLKLFQLYGTGMLNRLNGMFAFAIWDRQEKTLTMVRDRMGVKPLYYAIHDEALYFGSEQKALFAAGVPLKVAQDGMEEYIFNRFVAGEKTLYENVYKLLPGHVMTVLPGGKIKSEKWWDLKAAIQGHAVIKDPVNWFRETFDDSVRLRMVSDVPVGVLLSGGLDSSSILASLHTQHYKDIECFTIEFREQQHNEAFLAQNLASQYGYGFHSMILEHKPLYENMVEATYLQSEPLMHLSEPHILAMSKVARPKVKVLLSGEGADELMGGYFRYKPLQHPIILHTLAALGTIGGFSKNPRYDKLFRYAKIRKGSDLILYNGSNLYPDDIAQVFGISKQPKNEYRNRILEEAKSLYPGNLRRQALYFDQHTYLCSLLDRNDRCTMGASIECREPFLDPRLIVGAGALEDKWLFKGKKGKYVQWKAMENLLPPEILNFRKIGLSAPWGEYLLKDPAFKSAVEDFKRSPIFDFPYLEHIDPSKLVKALEEGNKLMVSYVMPLFMMHIWYRNYVEKFTAKKEIV